MIDWIVGDKIVCLSDTTLGYSPLKPNCRLKNTDGSTRLSHLAVGAAYTIRWIGVWESTYCHPVLCVRLLGVDRPDPKHGDVPFSASRFRPLIDKRAATELFERLCASADREVGVPA